MTILPCLIHEKYDYPEEYVMFLHQRQHKASYQDQGPNQHIHQSMFSDHRSRESDVS